MRERFGGGQWTDQPKSGNHEYISQERKITFDPTSGLRTTEGGIQSAAVGLAHEMVHAERHDRDPEGYNKDRKVSTTTEMGEPDPETGITEVRVVVSVSAEEKRATEVEGKIADELGEPKRGSYTDHKGPVTVQEPTFHCFPGPVRTDACVGR